ncbi:hypothetical protein PHYBOEH_011915 [Phytophthora boehmeriae]|uniref:ANK_REP_REGION domain-containing protein n=1 Tax=Phytophthora boehmeriae TaxID=109152 RepID=A0A8T1WX32_9STRA|nr:hypothetical protein PHYBOEH_011915 [Phytophthora boehmeriae]
MAFRCSASPLDEMKRLERLREQDPESAANLVANGKLLVQFAQEGNLRALQYAAEHLDGSQVLIFYVVRMFREACKARRLDMLRFMLLNGFDMQQNCVKDVLHSVVEGIDSLESADAAQPLLRFLLDAGVDINWQRKSDLYTALHVACRKNLYSIAYLLVLYGADVNAISADDAMPLACAIDIGRNSTLSQSDQAQKELLISFLIENGARATWRNQPRQRAAVTTAETMLNPESRAKSALSKPVILSLSSSFGIHCSIDESRDNEHHEGRMFDTSDPFEDL